MAQMHLSRVHAGQLRLRGVFLAALIAALTLVIAVPVASAVSAEPEAAPSAAVPTTAAAIDAYLASKGSPMAGQGAAFVTSGGAWKVDPRLLVAIAGAESAFGSVTCGPFNAWGYGCPNNPYVFASWAEAIDTVARGLRTNYLAEGRVSVALIQQKYAPSGAANDPTGLNNHWVVNVSQFLLEQGGDPNMVDLSGVSGSFPVGLEVTVTDPFDFTSDGAAAQREADADATDEVLLARPGAPARVEVTVTNSGTATWTPATVRLRRVDTVARLGSAPYAALTEATVAPGDIATFAIDVVVVGQSGGSETTDWRLEGPGGPFGAPVVREVQFQVGDLVAGEATVEAPDSLAAGEEGTVVVRIRNAGAAAWVRDGEGAVTLNVRAAAGPPLIHERWIDVQTPARLLERRVEPGETGSFAFLVRGAPGADPSRLELLPTANGAWAEGSPVLVTIA